MGRVSKSKREDAFRRSGGWCWFCGLVPAHHTEHLTPEAKGGTDDWSNLVGACRECNWAKEGQGIPGNPNWDLEEFREEVAGRRKVSPSAVQFYGERLMDARRTVTSAHPNRKRVILLGYHDDLVTLPEGSPIPPYDGFRYSRRGSDPLEWDE